MQFMRHLVRDRSFLRGIQMVSVSESCVPNDGLPCAASVDSIMDYGQFIILSTGNFLCSAATANSTMDFSTKPIKDNVVDSPPSGRLHPRVLCSPSLLRSTGQPTSPNSSDRVAQRKLYKEDGCTDIPQGLKEEVQGGMVDVLPVFGSLFPRRPSSSNGLQMKWFRSSFIYEANATTSAGALPPTSKCTSIRVAKRQCQSHIGKLQLEGSRRLWDAWKQKSLKKQMRENLCQRSTSSGGYSRGPEIFEALKMLKSRSHL